MVHALSIKEQESHAVGSARAGAFRTTGGGMLVLRQGAAWVTIDAGGAATPPHRHGVAPRGGDWFLAQGDRLGVPAGRRVVVESLDAAGIRFDWRPASAMAPGALHALQRCMLSAAALARGVACWTAHALASRGRPAAVVRK
ncbi:DUF2917 domain-containing protein [Xylophilus sp. ASV27]|uniref:DUF2917 domain-containing protein n=1 Tax=Xylophilus sp. ASV27 TaxID=2795129 RepID=UPI0018ED8C25|nr:DUF2917 domain-containing protein [Xylophilus sp. ASV27]